MEETADQIIAEMREWATGEGCFNDNPDVQAHSESVRFIDAARLQGAKP